MLVNCHAHVFNLKSVFTIRTLDTLLNRLRKKNWPDFILAAVKEALRALLKGKYLDEEALLQVLVTKLAVDKRFKTFLLSLTEGIPADLCIIMDGNVSGLAVGALRDLLRKLGERIKDNHDDCNETLNDLIAFLAIMIRPTIDEVARNLMKQMPDGAGAVALMMDITRGGDDDEAIFNGQLEDTSRTILAFPGRLFPFVAVNPMRTTHFSLMEYALMHRGFIGVKLYPSLGYRVDTPEMAKVLDYCTANSVPVLQHCNNQGFNFDDETAQYCHPDLWTPILKSRPGLRVCFGHFGGDCNLTEAQIGEETWTGRILALMEKFENVYADISYHTDPMQGGTKEANYFKNLRGLLQNNRFKSRILFGTDYHLVRQRLREDSHWSYWRAKLAEADFRQIAETNAAAYLGLPDAAGAGALPNIERYLDFIYGKRFELELLPAAWAVDAIQRKYGENVIIAVNRFGSQWSVNNKAHCWVWQFWRRRMWPQHQMRHFSECGGLLMRQMNFWNKEHETVEIFDAECKAQAERMNKFFLDTKGGAKALFEAGVTRAVAEKKMYAIIRNGDSRLADLAPVVDALYRFEGEVQA